VDFCTSHISEEHLQGKCCWRSVAVRSASEKLAQEGDGTMASGFTLNPDKTQEAILITPQQ